MEKTTDFIVIGSGISGLNAARVLASYGKVLIITKGSLRDSATYYAQGGIAAVTYGEDTIASHISDTLAAGAYHNNPEAVTFLVKQGKQAIADLSNLGIVFDKETSFEAAHSYPRIFHASDFTGRAIESALIRAVKVNRNIEVWEHSFAVDLIVEENRCYGVFVIANHESRITNHEIFARATILATGGVGQIYQWTTNPLVATGDGIAMAYRAGAKLADMEFVQFHPTALRENLSPLFLLSEALRGEGAILRDSKGERFIDELAPRDVVSRAIFHKQKKGEVFLDMRHMRAQNIVPLRFPNIYQALKEKGFDLTRGLIPVTPAAHFLCGGVVTDLYGRTSIENLFAYGEVAATGVHGASRLASNSLLEGFVSSGQIKECIKDMQSTALQIFVRAQNIVPLRSDITIEKQIKHIMWYYVGIERSNESIAYAIKKLTVLQRRGTTSCALDIITKNMLQTALLIAKAAKRRKESLGTHWNKNRHIRSVDD